jgi:hypothetical protein
MSAPGTPTSPSRRPTRKPCGGRTGPSRFTSEVPPEAGEPEIEAVVRRSGGFRQFVGAATVPRLIIVPGKIVNLIAAERSVAP